MGTPQNRHEMADAGDRRPLVLRTWRADGGIMYGVKVARVGEWHTRETPARLWRIPSPLLLAFGARGPNMARWGGTVRSSLCHPFALRRQFVQRCTSLQFLRQTSNPPSTLAADVGALMHGCPTRELRSLFRICMSSFHRYQGRCILQSKMDHLSP